MTSKPFLCLNRLVITNSTRVVYDQNFHFGVNIIRGENSSGKSTITDMIFYILGGENIEWTEEAVSCASVFAEFNVSGNVYSFKRDITQSANTSISVYDDNLNISMNTMVGWSVYGRQRTETKESFSQFLFSKLGFPETKSFDSQVNLTMYQVMRLLYADQNTDCTSIFRRERQPLADRQDLRRSIGEMLLGIDDFQGHIYRQKKIELEKKLIQTRARYDSLLEAAKKTDPNFTQIDYKIRIDELIEQQEKIRAALSSYENPRNAIESSHPPVDQARINTLENNLIFLNAEIQKLTEVINISSLNIEDSEVFIVNLESNLADLLDANAAKILIGQVSLSYCPVCLAELSVPVDGQCLLCKSHSTDSQSSSGRLRYEQELRHQIIESKTRLEKKKTRLFDDKKRLSESKINRNNYLEELRELVSSPSVIVPEISLLLQKLGYLKREIEDLSRLESLQEELDRLSKSITRLGISLADIQSELDARQSKQESRREYCQDRINNLTTEILHEDIVDGDNDSLRDAHGLIFSFDKDFLTVRHGRLSASTQAYLKNSFFFALLKFSLEDVKCRIPSFFILDNIEDKGMVPDRFRKFHRLLIEYSDSIVKNHQVILTTSYIDPELENSEYCVGKSYDKPPFTLDLNGEWGQ